MTRQRIVCIGLLGLWMCLGAASVAQAAGKKGANAQVEFRRLVAERDRQHRQLQKLDVLAAEALKRGEEPLGVHAEQIAVQDQLDLIQLRLEMLAMRHDLTIPPLPTATPDDEDGVSDERVKFGREFERGRRRATAVLQEQTLEVLRSVNYDEFLKRTEPE